MEYAASADQSKRVDVYLARPEDLFGSGVVEFEPFEDVTGDFEQHIVR